LDVVAFLLRQRDLAYLLATVYGGIAITSFADKSAPTQPGGEPVGADLSAIAFAATPWFS
jgi:hypothetical protein